MKKVIKIVIAIFLAFFILVAGGFTYSNWQDIKKMRHCSLALDGDEEVFFCLEDGRRYEAVSFPKELEYKDIIDILTSMKFERLSTTDKAEYHVYSDPFNDGVEYAVFVPLPSFIEMLPRPFSSTDAVPFAYYAVEVETSENVD